MVIGVVSHMYPGKNLPISGIFVKEELDSLSGFVELRLIAPLPNKQWFGEIGHERVSAGYPVVRPFVLAFPRWFLQRFYPESMALSLRISGHTFSGCDCIHAHNVFPDGVAAVKAFGGSLPVIITVHGSDINHFAMKPNLKPGIVEALNRASYIICVSSALEHTVKKLGVTSDTVIIPNGIDTELFTLGEKENACGVLNLDPGRPRILFAGNFVAVKGIEYCIRSLPQVLGAFPDCELLLIGAKPGTKDMTKYNPIIKQAGVEHAVRILECMPRKSLPMWFRASDVVVMPSIKEGFGLVAAEALACGRPVVATRSGGPEDIIEKGQGLLVEPKDSDALGDALIRVLGREGIIGAEELAGSAHRRFSYKNIAQRIVDIYKETLNRKKIIYD